MKTWLQSTTLALLCAWVGMPVSAVPLPATGPSNSPSSTVTNQHSLLGTWSMDFDEMRLLVIFKPDGEFNIVREQVYGDYQYYQLPSGDYAYLTNQISGDAFKAVPWPKYQYQGNLLKIGSGGEETKLRLEFAPDAKSVTLINESNTQKPVTLKRVSDRTELPANVEPLSTAEGHFYGLKKLVALQKAETQYWQKRRRFTKQVQSLKLSSLPQSDRRYRYQILQADRQQVIITAIPKQQNLRSFVLRVTGNNQSFNALLCGTDRPSTQLPALSKLKELQYTCPAQTHSIKTYWSW